MIFRPTKFEGVMVVEPEPRRDERGFLARTYCEEEFAAEKLNTRWVQQNHSATLGKGSVRGMHWQAAPFPEIKLVRCLVGKVLDVVVDVRPESPTFGQWHAEELSAENMRALHIPAGFAHGFQCLDDACELLYLMSESYHVDLARGLRWDDAEVAIAWPLSAINLSPRDMSLPTLNEIR